MKKLIVLLTILLCISALTLSAYADLILPRDTEEPETAAASVAETTAAPAAETAPAQPAPENTPDGSNQTALYVGIGVAVLAAGFGLWKLLSKREK